MNKFNYILNDLALSNLITRCLYSENADCSDKEELENQIKLIQQENKQLKDNWNELKEYINKYIKYDKNGRKISRYLNAVVIMSKINKLEKESDSNE